MLIRARFYGEIKQLIKKSWVTIELPKGSSLHDFILEITKNRGSILAKKFMESDKIRPEITILVNGTNIAYLGGLNTRLKDHDLISILPVVGGG